MNYKAGVNVIKSTEEIINKLIEGISSVEEVQAIGISGNKKALPQAGEGDIDIFVYCDAIPECRIRKNILGQMGVLLESSKVDVFEGGHWGVGDFGLINGVETWIMYFTVSDALKEIEAILDGDYPDKLDNYYYPTGRCAMLKDISVFYDKNSFLTSLKERLLKYPEKLEEKLIQYHFDELDDVEDLERAVTRRDVLFYHFAMDIALDHFLQALFAINKTYFPSRKRTLKFIENFNIKPVNCNERLLEIIKLGSSSEYIGKSYELWNVIVGELKKLHKAY